MERQDSEIDMGIGNLFELEELEKIKLKDTKTQLGLSCEVLF